MATQTDTFSFVPLYNAQPLVQPVTPAPATTSLSTLGVLAGLAGTWTGEGFNVIWRPFFGDPKHFLELNRTTEKLVFEPIQGDIPNRGLLQADIAMHGLTYLQQIVDKNADNAGLHIEPGIFALVPETTDPAVLESVVRMGSIPHGTTVHMQGKPLDVVAPIINPVSIKPFPIPAAGADPLGTGTDGIDFDEQDLSITTVANRTPAANLTGIDQALVDDPNSQLVADIDGQKILRTIVLIMNTSPDPVPGGGTANTAFLEGVPPAGPNADAPFVSAIFWIETVDPDDGNPPFLQLQYTQTVMLDFGGLRWPHVTVATMRKVAGAQPGVFAGANVGAAVPGFAGAAPVPSAQTCDDPKHGEYGHRCC